MRVIQKARMTTRELQGAQGLVALVTLVALALTGGAVAALAGATYVCLFTLFLAACLLIYLRQYEVMAVSILATSVLLDWYHLVPLPFYFPFLATTLATALIFFIFLLQSDANPWAPLTQTRLWIVMLAVAALAILPATNRIDAGAYYINVFLISFLMFTLGRLVTTSAQHLRRLVSLLSHFGALIGLHTVVIGLTGVFLFSTARSESYLASNNGFLFVGLNVGRVGSFLGNPDWDGIFLATVALLPLGLAFSEPRIWRRLAYLAEAFVILGGLLFTFTTGSWLSLGAGLLIFLALLGSRRFRLYGVAVLLSAIGVVVIVFHTQVQLLLLHALKPTGLALRLGAWLTAIKVIVAHPLTGVGLGYTAYVTGAEPFRDPAIQYRPLVQPHNTYLELAAMAGLPALAIFLVLLAKQARPLISAYQAAAPLFRPVIAGAIAAAVVLAVNSISIPGWTAEPLAALGWLLLGSLSSPLLAGASAKRGRPGIWHTVRSRLAWTADTWVSWVSHVDTWPPQESHLDET
jgi:O-antigen ligase